MCKPIHLCARVCVRVEYVYECTRTRACMHMCACVCVFVCARTFMHACVCTCLHEGMRAHTKGTVLRVILTKHYVLRVISTTHNIMYYA
jgi:type IV secretory pathway VirB3-like protein